MAAGPNALRGSGSNPKPRKLAPDLIGGVLYRPTLW
jgi:hypothetical protein